ncbi:hypothetical protein BGX27_000017 [Mortierella sp. AM989]|nr:hypothetical protein BGX27_000017 [Mortierella sp. AM989]
MSGSRLSVNDAYGETRAASILSRNSSRAASIQQVAATASALMNNPEARRIRMHLYGELVGGWYHLSTSSKVLLAYYIGVTFIEIVATVSVAVIERETAKNCFYLLLFLALYLLRAIVISIVLLRRFLYVRPDDLPRDLSGACGAHYGTMINWASLVLLLFSISLLATQSHCAQDSPGLFYLVLVLSLLGYLFLAILLTLWFLVLFCLNGVVFVLEMFGVGPRVMQWQGATQEMIDDIPMIKFTKHNQEDLAMPSIQEQQDSSLPTFQNEKMGAGMAATPSIIVSGDTATPHSVENDEHPTSVTIDIAPTTSFSEGNLTSFAEGHLPSEACMHDTDNPSKMLDLENLSPEERELAIRISTSCPICLCDYEDLEELRRLPCDHYFHKECVDEWLKLKRTCPLCKCDIVRRRGSKFWSHGHSRRSSSSGNANGSGNRSDDEPRSYIGPVAAAIQNGGNTDDTMTTMSDRTERGDEIEDPALSTTGPSQWQQCPTLDLQQPNRDSNLPMNNSPDRRRQVLGRLLGPLLSLTSSFPKSSSLFTAPSLPSDSSTELTPSSGPSVPMRRLSRPTTADGVFANISAKPEVDSRKNNDQHPPAYDSAVQDITPPYFEMTVTTPEVFENEIIVEGIPVGNLFQFLWNVVVAVSFQFLGVLLTYLLHNSHASKAGSMVGLGITLLNFGVRMRGEFNTLDSESDNGGEITRIDKPAFVDDTGYISGKSYGASADSAQMDWLDTDMENRWVSLILMIAGWAIIVKALAEYTTAIRKERFISVQPTGSRELELEV